MKCFVYIIQSIKTGEYYVGSAEDIERRLLQHNAGNVLATKHKRPYELVFSQEFDNTQAARKAEMRIKSWRRRDFIEKIVRDGKLKKIE